MCPCMLKMLRFVSNNILCNATMWPKITGAGRTTENENVKKMKETKKKQKNRKKSKIF